MGLLHKNLILASIASVAMVGFLNSSSASALDGFSFSDIISGYQNRTEQLRSYLTNPFGSGCEATNPDSTISCNETPFPNVLFNGAPNNSAWGHDGKGVIFVDSNNLVNGNPQLAVAKRGDTLNYSMEIETQRYNDAEMTKPVEAYAVYGILSKGLTIEQENIAVKVDERTIDPDPDSFTFDYISPEEIGELSTVFGEAGSAFMAMIRWTGDNGEFLFDEDAKITITYSALINEDAPSKLWSRGAYVNDINSAVDYQIFQSTDHQATALLDGNILIRRIDADGNPLAGAKYTIDGVKANVEDEASNIYVYDENGAISEFTTNGEGRVIIKGVPMGEYTVREAQAPQGHETKEPVITSPIHENLEEIKRDLGKYILDVPGLYGEPKDLTNYVVTFDGGRKGVNTGNMRTPGTEETFVAPFDETSGSYDLSGMVGDYRIVKDPDGALWVNSSSGTIGEHSIRFQHDNATGKEIAAIPYKASIFGGLMPTIKVEDGYATLVYPENGSFRLDYDPSNKEYTGIVNGSEYSLRCSGGKECQLVTYVESYGTYAGMPCEYDSSTGLYGVDEIPFLYLVLESVSDSELVLAPYRPILNFSNYHSYYIGLNSSFFGLETSIEKTIASVFLFEDPTEKPSPENIPNPQTSDAVLKAIVIAGIGLAPILVLRKQLTKRAN